jgi:hypothetical protein
MRGRSNVLRRRGCPDCDRVVALQFVLAVHCALSPPNNLSCQLQESQGAHRYFLGSRNRYIAASKRRLSSWRPSESDAAARITATIEIGTDKVIVATLA